MQGQTEGTLTGKGASMILQALMHCYNRMAKDYGAAVAPDGFEYKRIPYVIVLDQKGGVVALQDTRGDEADSKHGSLFMVPKGVKKSRGVSANLLWDSPSYVLAHPKEGPKKHEHKSARLAKERQRCFIDQIKQRFPEPVRDAGVKAVLLFLEQGNYSKISARDDWPAIVQRSYNLTFRLDGDDCLVCQRPAVIATISVGSEEVLGTSDRYNCLVTGARVTPVRIHTAIRGVWGTFSAGANLVSCAHDSFCSFGKEQGYNAPIGKQAEFAYTSALNMLLATPKCRLQIGDASAVFWSERKSILEDLFADLFREPAKENPGQMKIAIRSLSEACKSGFEDQNSKVDRFFLFALAPNVARIAIRLWYMGTVAETAQNIVQHFEDCCIVHNRQQPEHLSLFRLLISTAYRGRSEHIESKLACELMWSILSGGRYPHALLISVLRRCRAEHSVTHPRAAIIKGILVRQNRDSKSEQEIGPGLDTGNRVTGYLLGRLFSLIERAQEVAIAGIQSTIRDNFYGIASSTPALVFPHLIKLKNNYMEKVRNRDDTVLLEQHASEILGALHRYPACLPLHEQALFALGYYQQRHAFQHVYASASFRQKR